MASTGASRSSCFASRAVQPGHVRAREEATAARMQRVSDQTRCLSAGGRSANPVVTPTSFPWVRTGTVKWKRSVLRVSQSPPGSRLQRSRKTAVSSGSVPEPWPGPGKRPPALGRRPPGPSPSRRRSTDHSFIQRHVQFERPCQFGRKRLLSSAPCSPDEIPPESIDAAASSMKSRWRASAQDWSRIAGTFSGAATFSVQRALTSGSNGHGHWRCA